MAAANALALAYAESQAVCTPNTPVVTSATVTVGAGMPFSYQIQATNSPTSYGASSLPAGLTLNTSTGLITGTITSTSITSYTVPISASNGATGTGTLTIKVKGYLSIVFGTPAFNEGGGTASQFLDIVLDGGVTQAVVPGTIYNFHSSMTLSGTTTNNYTQPNQSLYQNMDMKCTGGVVVLGGSSYSQGTFTCTPGVAGTNLCGVVCQPDTQAFGVLLDSMYVNQVSPVSSSFPLVASGTSALSTNTILPDGWTTWRGFNPSAPGSGVILGNASTAGAFPGILVGKIVFNLQ